MFPWIGEESKKRRPASMITDLSPFLSLSLTMNYLYLYIFLCQTSGNLNCGYIRHKNKTTYAADDGILWFKYKLENHKLVAEEASSPQ